MDSGFCSDFLANFLSDLIVGTVLGSLLALWVGRRLGAFERSQQRRDERRTKLERAIRYLEILRYDVEELCPNLGPWIDTLKESGYRAITGSGGIPRIDARFWNVVEHSGKLPNLLSPDIVRSLTRFYGSLADARQSADWAIEGQGLARSAAKAMGRADKLAALTLEALESAMREGDGLIARIDSEIQRLGEELTGDNSDVYRARRHP